MCFDSGTILHMGAPTVAATFQNLSKGDVSTLSRDGAGNYIIPGGQFCVGHSNVRVTQTHRNTWVADYKDVITAVEGGCRRHAIRRMRKHMESGDKMSGKTYYELITDDLQEDEKRVSFIYLEKSGSKHTIYGYYVVSIPHGVRMLVACLQGLVAATLQKTMTETPTIYTPRSVRVKFIYAFRSSAFPCVIKIGQTSHVNNRLAAVSPFTVVAVAPSLNYVRDEKAAHRHFWDRRVKGEFFQITATEAKEYFTKIRAQFDQEFQNFQKPFVLSVVSIP